MTANAFVDFSPRALSAEEEMRRQRKVRRRGGREDGDVGSRAAHPNAHTGVGLISKPLELSGTEQVTWSLVQSECIELNLGVLRWLFYGDF